MISTMLQKPSNVRVIVMACCTLHNLLIDKYPRQVIRLLDREDQNHNIIPGQWRQNTEVMTGLQPAGRSNAYKDAKHQRKYLMHYYSSPVGKVSWQDKIIDV